MIAVFGAGALVAELSGHAASLPARTARATRHWATVGAARAAALAPRRTGNYASTIRATDDGWGSDHPAAHRLEVGFHGRDSLGRMRSDPPRPHHGPAARAVEEPYVESLADIADLSG